MTIDHLLNNNDTGNLLQYLFKLPNKAIVKFYNKKDKRVYITYTSNVLEAIKSFKAKIDDIKAPELLKLDKDILEMEIIDCSQYNNNYNTIKFLITEIMNELELEGYTYYLKTVKPLEIVFNIKILAKHDYFILELKRKRDANRNNNKSLYEFKDSKSRYIANVERYLETQINAKGRRNLIIDALESIPIETNEV